MIRVRGGGEEKDKLPKMKIKKVNFYKRRGGMGCRMIVALCKTAVLTGKPK